MDSPAQTQANAPERHATPTRSSSGADRRRHHRTRCLVATDVLTRRFAWGGTILDQSESGVFVASTAPVIVGDHIDLVFRHPEFDRSVHLRGHVVRLVRPGVGRRGVSGFGVQFFELATDQVYRTSERTPDKLHQRQVVHQREPRYPWGAVVQCVTENPRRRSRHYRLENASRGGIFLAGPKPPRTGLCFTVQIEAGDLDDGHGPLHFQVEVMWRHKAPDHSSATIGAGCKIIGFPTPSDRRRWEEHIACLAGGHYLEHG